MRIQITIDGDEKENALLREVFEKGNVSLLAEKWADFLDEVSFIQQKKTLDDPQAFWKRYRESRENAGTDDRVIENKQ